MDLNTGVRPVAMQSGIKIDEGLRALIPPLKPDERAALEASIAKEGVRDPLVVWEGHGLLLDGHNRYEIARRLGKSFETVGKSLPDMDACRVWMIDNQMGRRNLTPYQRTELALQKEDILKAQAKQRQREAGPASATKRTGGTVRQNSAEPSEQRETRTKIAKAANVSRDTVDRVRFIRDRADDETKEKLRAGEVSVNSVFTTLRREDQKQEVRKKLAEVETRTPQAASGVYDVIVCDPPWPMKKIDRDVRPNQVEFDYPTMSEAELAAVDIPAADSCHMFLWTTHKFMPMAFRLLSAWDFRYVCTFVWHKAGGFQPIGLPQYNCEFALYARKGSPEFIDTKAFNTCFQAPRGKHSEKPEEFYEVVSRVTGGRRLDMFNRRRIDGFDGWGKEAADVHAG